MQVKTKQYIRRTHRYLGVFIGIQFLAWTIGGLYFSWSDMDEVHGDYEKAPPALLAPDNGYVFPAVALDSLRLADQLDSLADLRLISILGKPFWQIAFTTSGSPVKKYCLADANTGRGRPPLTQAEAIGVARYAYAGNGTVKEVHELTETGGHHEYREQPLPAVAVGFEDDRHTVVYVATELGTVQKFRNRPWRQFDLLWMLHTMDYTQRDNITNSVLRVFSILGLLTVCSGFLLYFTSQKKVPRTF
ncbi:MAG: hypothetical protein EP344_03095 [Bacteroidetes bacterium]|nr:MAG: hypothetical protein EP344_03095 [Bacteroidota bacterium]